MDYPHWVDDRGRANGFQLQREMRSTDDEIELVELVYDHAFLLLCLKELLAKMIHGLASYLCVFNLL